MSEQASAPIKLFRKLYFSSEGKALSQSQAYEYIAHANGFGTYTAFKTERGPYTASFVRDFCDRFSESSK